MQPIKPDPAYPPNTVIRILRREYLTAASYGSLKLTPPTSPRSALRTFMLFAMFSRLLPHLHRPLTGNAVFGPSEQAEPNSAAAEFAKGSKRPVRLSYHRRLGRRGIPADISGNWILLTCLISFSPQR